MADSEWTGVFKHMTQIDLWSDGLPFLTKTSMKPILRQTSHGASLPLQCFVLILHTTYYIVNATIGKFTTRSSSSNDNNNLEKPAKDHLQGVSRQARWHHLFTLHSRVANVSAAEWAALGHNGPIRQLSISCSRKCARGKRYLNKQLRQCQATPFATLDAECCCLLLLLFCYCCCCCCCFP